MMKDSYIYSLAKDIGIYSHSVKQEKTNFWADDYYQGVFVSLFKYNLFRYNLDSNNKAVENKPFKFYNQSILSYSENLSIKDLERIHDYYKKN